MLLNPTLLIEVFSGVTEGNDRGKKFQHYRSIERFVKTGDGFWIFSKAVGLDSEIEFSSIEFKIALREVYDKINFFDE